MNPVRVLSVASEIYPIIKTGGLADVVGALPSALKAEGIEARTLVPGYPAVTAALQAAEEVLSWPDFHGGPARVLAGSCAGIDLFVLDAAHLFARPGNPYSSPDGADWPDNAIRFAGLGRVAADIAQRAIPAFVPDIVHTHDWQAGLTHAYLRYSDRPRPGTVMTVHNLAFQGQFPRAMLRELGLPPESFNIDGVEYYGSIGFLKAGLRFADRITTVSPTYALEIQRPDEGMGLDGLLRGRADLLSGILNGIDTAVWNPATDPHIASRFDAVRLEGRAPNKAALQQRLGLRVAPDAFLLGVISRLSWQKGLDLLLETLPALLNEPIQIAVLGNGDADLQNRYRAAAEAHPDRIGVLVGYDESLAHLIQAGADALVVPSRFEPCGLTQLCALRYGAVPIVSRVGGLADTVVDADNVPTSDKAATGITFSPVTTDNLTAAIRRAHALFRKGDVWPALQHN
ncbi:MAG TPA: glycogen synthase GlgA, partial [Acetobacteraceae bacterium]|nr:glycogen synthase GlgA [Acetobacteraceae bacterium]